MGIITLIRGTFFVVNHRPVEKFLTPASTLADYSGTYTFIATAQRSGEFPGIPVVLQVSACY